MRCPVCGATDLVHETRDLVYVYKGRAVTVPAIAGEFCAACDEAVLGEEEARRYEDALRTHIQAVNRSVAPDVRRIRRKLGLNQRRAGEIFGGGVNAFSRYERGETEPPAALVQLLRLLDRHPELLDEVIAKEAA